MKGYCNSCGAPIHGNYKFCTMCSGNLYQGSDDYAQQDAERAERGQQTEEIYPDQQKMEKV